MAETRGSAPSFRIRPPIRLQILRGLPDVPNDRRQVFVQLVQDPTQVLKSLHHLYARRVVFSYEAERYPLHRLAIATSLLRHQTCVFWSHRFVRWCLISHPSGMCILYKSRWGSGSLLYCSAAIPENKCLYMKCSLIRTTLCTTSGHPGTRHLTIFGTGGKETT